jgi:lipopolysaccharide/colanic/teichoic acid biosynthesis glycosyltransferase
MKLKKDYDDSLKIDVDLANKIPPYKQVAKRIFDLTFSLLGLILTGPLIIIAYLIASLETGESGFFKQTRVGEQCTRFKMIKIKTMDSTTDINTNVTTRNDPRITKSGRIFRKFKLDELPQLINVLKGDMSFVGPRPDVPEVIKDLADEDKLILSVKPGITGPATLKYEAEEDILAEVAEPEKYNREVIFPDKIRINKEYIRNYSFLRDLKYIGATLLNVLSL